MVYNNGILSITTAEIRSAGFKPCSHDTMGSLSICDFCILKSECGKHIRIECGPWNGTHIQVRELSQKIKETLNIEIVHS